MQIFVVEDNKDLNDTIVAILELKGHKCLTFTDGQNALDNISKIFDIYLIDITLPNINGLVLVEKIKESYPDTPCFIISGDNNIETIAKAYDIGVDDYIKKPFDVRELLIKIEKVADKNKNIVQLTEECFYDLYKKSLVYKNVELSLTSKENILLYLFVKNINYTVSKEAIEFYVWGENIGNGYVRQLVNKLRKVLPCDIIKNHVGKGYRIEEYRNV